MQEARKNVQVLGKACSLLLSHHLIQSWLCSSSVSHCRGSHLSSGWQLASHFCYALFKSSTVHRSPPKWDIRGLRPSQTSSYSRIAQGSPKPMRQEVNPKREIAAVAKASTRQENQRNQERNCKRIQLLALIWPLPLLILKEAQK